MYTRHDELPPFASRPDQVEGRLYNLWRLTALRKELPLRLGLPGMRGLALLLTNAVWVCVDPQLNDLPILAWTGFHTHGRTSLHAPVACELRYYHVGGSMVRAKVLDHMGVLLDQRLAVQRGRRAADLGVSSR
jgi:hypothetical protein